MKRDVEVSGFAWRKWVIGIILIGLFWSIWFLFFSYEDCKNQSCFDDNLRNCDRARFVSGEDMIFRYVIDGESDGECEIDVELLQGELNNEDSRRLEGKSMTCMLPLGVVVAPESNIGVCHGLLKEELQDSIIRKLHIYLVQNLGRLNLEMAGIPESVINN